MAIRELETNVLSELGEGIASQAEETEKPLFTEDQLYEMAFSEQDGDADLFSALNKNRLCFDHSACRWYEWQGHHWKEDRTGEVMLKIDGVIKIYQDESVRWYSRTIEALMAGNEKLAEENQSKSGLFRHKIQQLQRLSWKRDILKLAASSEKRLGISGEEWDNDPWLLGCSNGVLELRTGNFRDGEPSDYIKTVCCTEWRGYSEPCPNWEQFLSEIFNGNSSLISFLQRLLGCAIAGSAIEHILPIFWGKGRNGKSTLFDILNSVLGSLAEPIKAEMLLDQGGRAGSSKSPDADIMSLRGRRIVWGSETDEGRKLNIGKAKWLSGGDILKGREPYGRKEISFTPTHVLFLLTNHRPKTDSDDYALWQRIHLVPFTMSFVDDPHKPNEKKRDPHLPEKLKAEASGILAWLVRGCLEWQYDGQGLNPPKEIKEATAAYQRDEDLIGQFIDECCYLSPEAKVKAGRLREEFESWCRESGISNKISGKKLSSYIGERFSKTQKTSTGVYYLGIQLLNDTQA